MINEIFVEKALLLGRLTNSEGQEIDEIRFNHTIVNIDEVKDEHLESHKEFMADEANHLGKYASDLCLSLLDVANGIQYRFKAEHFDICYDINCEWWLHIIGFQSAVIINYKAKPISRV